MPTSALLGESASEDREGPVNPRLTEIVRALFTYHVVSLTSREIHNPKRKVSVVLSPFGIKVYKVRYMYLEHILSLNFLYLRYNL